MVEYRHCNPTSKAVGQSANILFIILLLACIPLSSVHGAPYAIITFSQVGISSDYTGTVLAVWDIYVVAYYGVNDLPVTWNEFPGMNLSFYYYSPLNTHSCTRYVWTRSSGLSVSKSGTIYVTNNESYSVTGYYKKQYQCTVTSSPATGDGFVAVDGSAVTTPYTTSWWDSGSSHTIAASSTVTIASGQSQYAYSSWSDSGAQSHSISPSVCTYTANFVTQYYFSVSSAHGSPTGQGWYNSGTSISSTVTRPASGGAGVHYETTGFTGTGSCPSSSVSSQSTTGSFIITQYSTVTWYWKTQYYLTVVSPYGAAGGQGWYDEGSIAHATIVSGDVISDDRRHIFTGWSGDASGAGLTSNDIRMNAPKTATANWGTQYYIAVTSAYGTPTASQWLDPGSNLIVSVTSPENNGKGTRYRCTGYTLDRNLPITDGSASYTFTNIQSSHTITFNWIAQYYLNVTSDYGDLLGGGWYDANSMATFSVTSPVGTFIQQVFVGWSGDSMATTPSGSINMNGPKTVVANWRADYTQLSITVATIAGASIGALALTKRLPIRKPTKPTPKPPPLPVERIVDTGFSSQTGAAAVLDPFLPLALAQYYYFWFEVGPPVPESIELKPDPLIVKWYTPSDTRLKVVLFAFDGEIEIKSGGDIGEIHIMPDGQAKVVRRVEHPDNIPVGSDLLNRRLFFLVHTPNKEGTFRLRCNIYYEQILVQSRLIQARVSSSHVRSNVPALQSAIEYALSKTLNPNYLARMIPHKLSVMLNINSEGTHCFRLYGEKDYKGNACFNAQDLETLVRDIRGALHQASWGDEEPWTEGKNYHYEGGYNEDRLKEDLINFAIRGYRFWSRLNEKIGPLPEVKELEKLILKPAFLGFAIRDKAEASHLFPVAMIYDYPLDTNLNRKDYKLCPSFLRALKAGDSLEETSCFTGDCPSRGDLAVICPSGFWGFRHRIGNPLGSRSEINHEILYRDAPELTVAVARAPALKEWPPHMKALKDLNQKMIWNFADTRSETFKELKSTTPHVIYFYCHGGVSGNTPYIKVGGENEMGITPDNLDAYEISWASPQPLIFINGCHTVASEPTLALQFVDKFVITCNAAGVIGTEITIFEPLARDFAEECLRRFLVTNETIGDAVRGARLKLLREGNPLGLVYNIYAIACLRLEKAPPESYQSLQTPTPPQPPQQPPSSIEPKIQQYCPYCGNALDSTGYCKRCRRKRSESK